MIDEYLSAIEQVQDDGGVVLVKWDGLRVSRRHTVVVSRDDTDFVWHEDCDDIEQALRDAIDAYRTAHPR